MPECICCFKFIASGFRNSIETSGDGNCGLTQHQSHLSIANELLEADAIHSLRNNLLKELDVTEWMYSTAKYQQQM